MALCGLQRAQLVAAPLVLDGPAIEQRGELLLAGEGLEGLAGRGRIGRLAASGTSAASKTASRCDFFGMVASVGVGLPMP
jgi:hypothetical protein